MDVFICIHPVDPIFSNLVFIKYIYDKWISRSADATSSHEIFFLLVLSTIPCSLNYALTKNKKDFRKILLSFIFLTSLIILLFIYIKKISFAD